MRQRQVGFRFKEIKHLTQPRHIRCFKIIRGVLAFCHLVHIPACAFIIPANILEVAHPLQRHGDAFQSIGNFHRGHIQHHPTGLLEVGELGDFLPVQPHFPSQTPGAQRGGFPIVFHETDVVLVRVDADGAQGIQVKFLGVARVWLEDDLKLIVHLQAIGVDAVAPVVRADRRLHISNLPGLGAQHAQKSGWVHGASADLGVVRLPDQAALARPVILQREHNRLKIERFFSYG